MADVFSKAKRSEIMGRIRSKNTSPERLLAELLRRSGIKFRRHYKKLAGTPDIVLPIPKVALFLNGCFWHGHQGCIRAQLPSTNQVFWANKIKRNTARDRRRCRLIKKQAGKF